MELQPLECMIVKQTMFLERIGVRTTPRRKGILDGPLWSRLCFSSLPSLVRLPSTFPLRCCWLRWLLADLIWFNLITFSLQTGWHTWELELAIARYEKLCSLWSLALGRVTRWLAVTVSVALSVQMWTRFCISPWITRAFVTWSCSPLALRTNSPLLMCSTFTRDSSSLILVMSTSKTRTKKNPRCHLSNKQRDCVNHFMALASIPWKT